MRVIVVGAGIGGLSLAIGLRRAGHEPVVLEQAPRVEAVGAGITLFGNATHALDVSSQYIGNEYVFVDVTKSTA